MLQKEFFQVQPFNPSPYWNPVVVNLSGAQKFEENTVFVPGRYRIEVAPGGYYSSTGTSVQTSGASYFNYEESITIPFIVRAYCGSNASVSSIGINPYSGVFKVNGLTTDTQTNGIDVNHIFGAGGGNAKTSGILGSQYRGGGNCLGNGSKDHYTFGNSDVYFGAGSCLHILPVDGTFGTDFIRAYHAAPYAGICGGAYGGGAAGPYGDDVVWTYRGGNSPYGNGGNSNRAKGDGVGGGGTLKQYTTQSGTIARMYVAGGAYFNGINWIDVPGNPLNTVTSIIRITYLGPLN